MREFSEIGEDDGRIGADLILVAQLLKGRGCVSLHQRLEQVNNPHTICQPQHLPDIVSTDRTGGMRHRLVEQRQ